MSGVPLLKEEQLEQYRRNGFLVVEGLLSSDECDALIRNAEGMLTGQVPLGEGNAYLMEPDAVEMGLVTEEKPDHRYLFKIGHRMHITDPVFRAFAKHGKILDALTSLIGPDIQCVQSMYINKPANIGVGQPYHQDSHYIRMEPDTLIGVWIALDNVDEHNGCLYVIPGSHLEPIHPHKTPIDERQRRLYIEVHSARDRAEKACRLPKGGAVFFPGTMLHRSGNNVTPDRERRAYVLHYASARSKQDYKHALEQHLLVKGSR